MPVWQADLQVRVFMLNDEGPEDEGDGEATSCQIWMSPPAPLNLLNPKHLHHKPCMIPKPRTLNQAPCEEHGGALGVARLRHRGEVCFQFWAQHKPSRARTKHSACLTERGYRGGFSATD